MPGLRVLVVDDQPEFLNLAESLLNGTGITVVATASNGWEALQLVHAVGANVALIDIHMPGMSGFAAAKELVSRYPGLRVVMVSSYADPQYEELSKTAGAVAFMPKRDLSPEAVAAAIG